MGFFKNRTFNLIYIHGALQAFAAHGGEAFAFIYLLKAGISPAAVLVAIAALFSSRVLFRKMVLPAVKRFGLRNALVGGIVLEALTYPLLAHVTEVGPVLLVYLFSLAISSSFYWTTYHAFVALIGDSELRGSQVSGLEFIGTIIGIGAPILSGILLTYFPPLVAFSVVGLAMALSALPLLFAPNLRIAENATLSEGIRVVGFRIALADGLRAGAFHFTWLIALFITLRESYLAFGGALAFAGVVGAIAGLFVGKNIDLGKGQSALKLGFIALTIAVLARSFGYGEVWSAVLANAAAAVAWPLYATATNSRMYDLSRQSECPLRYHVVAEGGWDSGTAASCLLAALFVYFGVSFFWSIIFALVGCAFGYQQFSRSFKTFTES